MHTLDGSTGGGQLLRTALSLSAVTGEAFELEDVRANRPNPGLKPQHVAVVDAVAALCDAAVEGGSVDSTTLTFQPGELHGGTVEVDIGTAGSVTLLFDAVLPLAARLPSPVEVTARGGTDVAWSPPAAYLQRVKLPLLARHGFDAEVVVSRTGFYPAGGGEATLTVRPSTLSAFNLVDRGPLEHVAIVSTAAEALAEAEVADRQADRATELLEARDVDVVERVVRYPETACPGSSLVLVATYACSLAGVSALGERGTPSETVAEEAVERFVDFDDGPGAVDEHLADQLLVPLALAGGRVVAPRVTEHVSSNAAVIEAFGFDVDVEAREAGGARLRARTDGR